MFSPHNLETDPNGLVQRSYDLQSGTAAMVVRHPNGNPNQWYYECTKGQPTMSLWQYNADVPKDYVMLARYDSSDDVDPLMKGEINRARNIYNHVSDDDVRTRAYVCTEVGSHWVRLSVGQKLVLYNSLVCSPTDWELLLELVKQHKLPTPYPYFDGDTGLTLSLGGGA